jgi:hypothetical protein
MCRYDSDMAPVPTVVELKDVCFVVESIGTEFKYVGIVVPPHAK